jgi:H+/Cl- antiporter ClcA
VEPKIAILKPISAAIAIGSGGPFGAEGPIIMTGGAFGSLIAQWIKLTDAERTTLLVAGAAAGMSATFATPLAAILLAVELLLFELRPRSLAPVAIASATAAVLRGYLLGPGPLFPMPVVTGINPLPTALGSLLLGALLGLVAAGMSRMTYAFEDMFEHLPLHWMWWPALGYDNIAQLLRGNAPLALILGIILVKSVMWAFSLGSGTSGGVLAPLLMIGGAVGALAARFGHASVEMQAIWALIGMGSMLSGSLGVPLTAILFGIEVTHCLPALLPLTLGCVASYLITALLMPRSILTEKLSRRGYHLTREYGIDPLEIVIVGDLLVPASVDLSASALPRTFVYSDATCRSAAELMATEGLADLPVVDRKTKRVSGVITLQDLLKGRAKAMVRENERLSLIRHPRVGKSCKLIRRG